MWQYGGGGGARRRRHIAPPGGGRPSFQPFGLSELGRYAALRR